MRHLILVAGLLAGTPALAAPLYGMNLSDLEVGNVPGQEYADYGYGNPTGATWSAQNVQVIRLPIKLERLFAVTSQTYAPPATSIDTAYQAEMQAIISRDQSANVMTVVDPHDFGSIGDDGTYRSIVDGGTGTSEYLDAMTRLAGMLAGQSNVTLGLMNEPNGSADTCAALTPIWQRAITAIRGAGFTGPIMLSSPNYDGASSFVGSGCDGSAQGVGFSTLVDPDNDLIAEVHDYPDPSNQGNDPVSDPNAGVAALSGVVAWSQRTGIPIFVGEFGVQTDPTSLQAESNVLAYIKANAADFWGVTLWAGGPPYQPSGTPGGYSLSLNPQANGQPAPQMSILAAYTAPPEALVLSLVEDAYQGDAPYAVTLDGKLVTGQRIETQHRTGGGAIDLVTIPGPFASGRHTVSVTFLQDAYGGSPSADRNLYPLGATYQGVDLETGVGNLLSAGSTASVTFVAQ